jgi:NADH:ubiquinone reductase (non-electrogenic)
MARPRLVILGSGFGAFSLIREIDTSAHAVTVVSPRNHFVFTPLLPSTTVGTIEFRSIIEPVRTARTGIAFHEAACTGVDRERRTVRCRQEDEEFSLDYDILVIAVGAGNNTYGIPGVEEHALFLKEVADARAIRQRIIACCERASVPGLGDEERRRLVHVVVVGGGPTGVEFAAEMYDFLTRDLVRSYPLLRDLVRITLIEASGQLLSTFDATLSAYTARQFRRQRIEVRTGVPVASVGATAVHLRDGSAVPYGLLVWSTGIAPRPVTRILPFPKDPPGRILVDPYLCVRGETAVYALGDCATQEEQNLPATSQVAQQEGRYLGRALNRRARGRDPKPFVYKHLGMLAYIGSNRALADLAAVKGRGFATWLFWRSTYLTKLVSPKNKLLVLFDWFKTLVFGRDISRF